MKQVLALGAVVAVGLYATGAWSAAQPTPVEKKLQRDVTALKAQMKALQADVKKNGEWLKRSVAYPLAAL